MEDGYKSLKLILDYLYIERRFESLGVWLKEKDIEAINPHKKIGFKDMVYINPNAEDVLNLVFLMI